jgi:MarR family transcriptional regulator, temperature-dependent positive regulator of motility
MLEYRVIKELEDEPAHTQRSLARRLDVSLGRVHYVLSGLIEKGIVKTRRLTTSPGKVRWQYILTPAGLAEKTRIAKAYLRQRLTEYETMTQEIAELRREIAGMDSKPDDSDGLGAR